MFTVVFSAYVTKQNNIVWFQKISIPPPRKGSDFPGGRWVNLPNFPVGTGGSPQGNISRGFS